MKRWQHIVRGVGSSGILLRQLARHAPKDVRIGRICTAKRVPHRSELVAHQLILFLSPTAKFSIRSQARDLCTRAIVGSGEVSYILDCCDVSEPGRSTFEPLLTLCEDFPLARLAAGGVGKNVI
jgi:hypothetical protein